MIRSYTKFLGLAACLAWAALPLAAQDSPRVELIHGRLLGATPPMRVYVATHRVKPNPPMRVFPLRKPGSHPGKGGNGSKGGGSTWSDTVLQSGSSLTDNATQIKTIDGITSVGYVPPDTNISVGNGQIVETVNVDYAVYSTSGGTLQGATPIHAIFAAAGNLANNDICTSVDGGDPIVLYDKVDSRWIISQLAFNNSFSNNHLCLAISKTASATGSYSAYDFSFGRNLPDYPKLGIWADGAFSSNAPHAGVYFSANIFSHGSRFTGAEMCAFPLSAVSAQPSSLTMVCAQNATSVYSILPADLGGAPSVSGTTSPAPSGTAEYYMQFSGSNTLNLYQFTPDFNNNTASVTNPANITVAGFHEACGGGTCVPQPGTSQQLDSLGDRLMYRLSYRDYNGTQSMVVTHSVQDDSSSNQTGVRWYQLTNTGSGWKVGQDGTFASGNGTYYWMGSVGQDKLGDIALGFSTSSGTQSPGMAYTGQTPTQASAYPNELQPANPLNIGSGSQTTVSRWGDYSSISVDPSNDCTFWYANEYLKSTGSYTNWGTYIVGFQFPGCQ